MAQFIVRNIQTEVKRRLQRRAARNGRSMEEEVRDILRDALKNEKDEGCGLGSEIASLFSRVGLNSEIPELRGQRIDPPSFDE